MNIIKYYSICFAITLTSSVVLADQAIKATPTDTGAETKAARRAALGAKLYAKTGGVIQAPATGPQIIFLNAQEIITDQQLNQAATTISKITRLPISVATGKITQPMLDAYKLLAPTNVAALLMVVNIPGQPSLLVAPENRWAMVNAAPLADAETSADLHRERLLKEVWRGFGYLMGAANSTMNPCLLKGVIVPNDLDDLKAVSLSIEPLQKIVSYSRVIGMTPSRLTTYRNAVIEGWAPAPTNDIQRAIWQEVKAETDNKTATPKTE